MSDSRKTFSLDDASSFKQKQATENSAPQRPAAEPLQPLPPPMLPERQRGERQFSDLKSEPSWIRKTLGHGFKLFKENSRSHTIASISLDDINQAKVDDAPKAQTYKPQWQDAKAPGFARGAEEFTTFSRASKEFMKEEEQRRQVQAQRRAQGQMAMGHLGQSAAGSSSGVRVFVLLLVVGGGLLGGRFAWKWLHSSDSKMARTMRAKIGVEMVQAVKRDNKGQQGSSLVPSEKDELGGEVPPASSQGARPRRLK